MKLIEIETDAGTLLAKATYEIEEKHWIRIKEILETVDDKKTRKNLKVELFCTLFAEIALCSWVDRKAFMWLSSKKRVKAMRFWVKYCTATIGLEHALETFSIDCTENDENSR